MIRNLAGGRLTRATVGAAVVLGAVVIPVQDASALTATRVTRLSDNTSANKSITATCPDDLDLIGTGAQVIGGNGEVLITDIIPSADLRSVTVWGAENGAYPGTWKVQAVAVCSSVASSLSRVAATSDENGTSVSPRSASVLCPAGEVLLGMGYTLSGANGNVFPSLLVPVGNPPDMAVVGAIEDLAYAPTWNLKVYGICGVVSVDVEVAMASAGPGSDSPRSVTASCPTGMNASSAGADNGGQPSGHDDDLIIERMTPSSGLGSTTARVAENLGLGTDWTMTAYSICVD